eukprot:CAMPEP_0184332688 /NCGR_PEP_ID=MMETSP1089-20130417/1853_1 /TAXON_ID=38269 ORGANISM="Gloeochaete wittrockiana, Strain SAG46.84" /NCGR_SAMPLE_ID=MMETSP1089 /ASSEMBLY_ACC=CAM_ASM_000445 /LENGTH=653 /DNA_ID=CAMNT_0026656197 /DNA_START=49 /DNA_END=2010 /DNA_ORIENTATION=+
MGDFGERPGTGMRRAPMAAPGTAQAMGTMGRPASRGFVPGNPGAPAPVAGPLRPTTGMIGSVAAGGRQPTSMGAPPGTAGVGRPGTGGRGGTAYGARMGTASGAPPQTAGGVGLNTNVQVDFRPVTTQGGMMGMRTGTVGPGRQIQDKSYYMGELRAKINELSTESKKLKDEHDKYLQDNTTYAQLERKYEAMQKELKQLQGQLADYNLMVDKVRGDQEVEQIRNEFNQLKAKNDADRKRLDAVFMDRTTKETQTRELESQVNQLLHSMEQRLNELSPDKRQLYHSLQDENVQLLEKVAQLSANLDDVARELQRADEDVKADTQRQRAIQLEEQKRQLEIKKRELEEETMRDQMSFPEAREQLLKKVKDDNVEIAEAEKKVSDLNNTIAQYREQVAQMNSDLEEYRGEKGEKYQELLQKDKEMQEFIDKFEETRKSELVVNAGVESTIVALLQHISLHIDRERTMPSQDKFDEMKQELDFKKNQLENTQTTFDRLKQELVLREVELDKIKTLDSKIGVELASLKDKSKFMKEEMVVLANIDALKDKHEIAKENAINEKNRLSKRKENLKQQTGLLSAKYDSKKLQLAENETATALDALEQKLRHYEQNIFHLHEFIETKERESNFKPAQSDCLNFTSDLNTFIIKAQQASRFA